MVTKMTDMAPEPDTGPIGPNTGEFVTAANKAPAILKLLSTDDLAALLLTGERMATAIAALPEDAAARTDLEASLAAWREATR